MNSYQTIRACLFLFLLACMFRTSTKTVDSQGCCPVPSSEVSGIESQTNPSTLTEFNMTISNAGGTSFDGRQVQEEYGNQGTNTCYYAGGPTPQHPTVSNPTNGVPPWVVAGGLVSGQHNHWGLDIVGVFPDDVAQVRVDHPEMLPCALVIFQNMWIECDASTHIFYEENNVLEIFIHSNHVENCRRAVLDTTNRCEQLNN